jgi:glycine cleavage system H protein
MVTGRGETNTGAQKMTIKYSKDHEWISVDSGVGTVGISDHAQQALGDVVFVEVPEVGRKLKAKDTCAVVESVKAASDIYAPVSGEVVAVNEAIVGNPALVNEAAEGGAWFFKIKLSDPKELDALMDKSAYAAFCKSAA